MTSRSSVSDDISSPRDSVDNSNPFADHNKPSNASSFVQRDLLTASSTGNSVSVVSDQRSSLISQSVEQKCDSCREGRNSADVENQYDAAQQEVLDLQDKIKTADVNLPYITAGLIRASRKMRKEFGESKLFSHQMDDQTIQNVVARLKAKQQGSASEGASRQSGLPSFRLTKPKSDIARAADQSRQPVVMAASSSSSAANPFEDTPASQKQFSASFLSTNDSSSLDNTTGALRHLNIEDPTQHVPCSVCTGSLDSYARMVRAERRRDEVEFIWKNKDSDLRLVTAAYCRKVVSKRTPQIITDALVMSSRKTAQEEEDKLERKESGK